jgi:peptide/nickel transport system substrate-binding protein
MFFENQKRWIACAIFAILIVSVGVGCAPSPTPVPPPPPTTAAPVPAPATSAPAPATSAPVAKPTEVPAATKPAATTAPTAVPAAKQTLIVGVDLEPKTLDPLFGDAPGGPDRYSSNLLYEGLYRAEPDGTLTPMLAESWKLSDDSMTVTFNLRKGIKFHDGTDFNAEAAAFNLSRVASKDTNSPRRADAPALQSAQAVDSLTLRVVLSAPSAATMVNLAYEAGRMASPTAVKALGKDYGRKPVGTGPYRFVEWRSGDRITFERNNDYWRLDKDGKRLPYADTIVMRFIPDVSVKMVELRTGNIHIGDFVPPINYATVRSEPSLKLVDSPSGITQWMSFNVTKPPFDNEKLRTAILTAVDRDALNKVVTLGLGTVVPSLAAPGDWFYDPNIPYPKYDPVRAKTLLAEAGYPNGLKTTMSIIQRDPDTQIGQLMQAQLKQVGVDVELQVLERQAWIDKVLAYNYEMAQLRIGLPRPDPANTFGPSFGTGAGNNWSGVKDSDLTKLTDDAGKTLDQAKRKEMYKQIQQMVNQRSYYAFLFFRPVAFPMSVKVQTFPMDVDSAWRLGEVKLNP